MRNFFPILLFIAVLAWFLSRKKTGNNTNPVKSAFGMTSGVYSSSGSAFLTASQPAAASSPASSTVSSSPSSLLSPAPTSTTGSSPTTPTTTTPTTTTSGGYSSYRPSTEGGGSGSGELVMAAYFSNANHKTPFL